MQAILTKFLPYTEKRPSRIKAYIADNEGIIDSVCVSTSIMPYASHTVEAHRIAAERLKQQLGWKNELVAGGTNQGFVFVPIE